MSSVLPAPNFGLPAGAVRQSTRNRRTPAHIKDDGERASTSPVPTTASSASARSAQRMTRSASGTGASPENGEKSPIENKKSPRLIIKAFAQPLVDAKTKEKKGKLGVSGLGLDLGTQQAPNNNNGIEEGEPELDNITVNGDQTSSHSIGSRRSSRSRKSQDSGEQQGLQLPNTSPKSETLTPSPPKIILTFRNKRKSEGDSVTPPTPMMTIAEEPPAEDKPANDKAEDQSEGEKAGEPLQEAVAEPGGSNPAKRAPRKKRKYLKKGEVDPDDPIAVARQQQKHMIIDEALASLDKQAEMLTVGDHPQLLWILGELERRYSKQMALVECRREAQLWDLDRMREHNQRQAKVNWQATRDHIADTLMAKNAEQSQILHTESNFITREMGDLPYLRDGRGFGGWPTYPGPLLSDGTQPTTQIRVGDVLKLRRGLTHYPCGMTPIAAEEELLAMGGKRRRRHTSGHSGKAR